MSIYFSISCDFPVSQPLNYLHQLNVDSAQPFSVFIAMFYPILSTTVSIQDSFQKKNIVRAVYLRPQKATHALVNLGSHSIRTYILFGYNKLVLSSPFGENNTDPCFWQYYGWVVFTPYYNYLILYKVVYWAPAYTNVKYLDVWNICIR